MNYAAVIEALENFPQHVRYVREGRNQSYREAAAESGVTASFLYAIETGRKQPTLPVILRLVRWMAEY